jgi:hypothetical protein
MPDGDSAMARSGARIRLTDERWGYILAGHPEFTDLRRLVCAQSKIPTRYAKGEKAPSWP